MNNRRAEAPKTIDGFPAILCPKCHGEGIIHGYRHVDGGECFKCQGKGNLIAPEHAAAYEAWKADVKAAREVAYGDVKVGDVLIASGYKRFIVEVESKPNGDVRLVSRSGFGMNAPADYTIPRHAAPEDLPKAADYLK